MNDEVHGVTYDSCAFGCVVDALCMLMGSACRERDDGDEEEDGVKDGVLHFLFALLSSKASSKASVMSWMGVCSSFSILSRSSVSLDCT